MMITYIILSLLILAVWLDEHLDRKRNPILGEEWDFTKNNYIPK